MSWSGSAWSRSTEEFHYAFDSSGRLEDAAFAQTPTSGQTNYETYPAATRARAHYEYDPGGRVLAVEHYWDTFNTGTNHFDSAKIVRQTCSYDAYLGLKTQADLDVVSGSSWSLDHSELYGYQASTGYLTSAFVASALLIVVPSYVTLSPDVQSMMFGAVAVLACLVSDGRVDWDALKTRFAAAVTTAAERSQALRRRGSPVGARTADEALVARTAEGAV